MLNELLENQILNLKKPHFHILYWTAMAEEKGVLYNITNIFDDLKFIKATRTKQSAVAYVEALASLCFITINSESNRKNIYITKYGARALEYLLSKQIYKTEKSLFLEVSK
ncbi:MAG: hypothetical protein K9L78_01005 [Victivallales bacterium]|nr:hypothetical protein [Victivallales bacterium]MCF7888675.1 hypothetical protein [Victivallales bacterium]